MTRKFFFFAAALWLAQSAATAQPIAQIDSIVATAFAQRHVGSVTAGIVTGNRLIWTKSYGDADMEKKILADKDTVYRIGSITKMFTALMLDQLIDTGKVRLSDPAEKYFPEVRTIPKGRFPNSPPITLMQLATHTAGLSMEPDDVETYVKGPDADWEKTLIAALPHTRFQFEPGTRYSYSNIGYAILGAALARAAVQPYMEYVPKFILQPLGMEHSALQINPQLLPHIAKGYEVGRDSIDSDLPAREHEGRGYKMPNGAMYTTVGDLALFASWFMGQDSQSLPRSATMGSAVTQYLAKSDADTLSGYSYGIGFELHRRENYTAVGHNGAVAGYTAALYMNRTKGVAVILLASTNLTAITNVALRSLDILSIN